LKETKRVNPSLRKQVFSILFDYPFGNFYKFVLAENEKEARRLAIRWLLTLEKEGLKEVYISKIEEINSIKDVLRLEGLVLKEGK